MSVKIFNGFRFLTNDFVEIHQRLAEWRRELDALQEEKLAEIYSHFAITLIDEATLFPEECAKRLAARDVLRSPYGYAMSMVFNMQAVARKHERRLPAVDHDFELSLMPFEGRVYGMIHTNQPDWETLWLKKPFIEDFAYWNNSDRPDDVSEEVWNERSRVWHGIMDVHPSTVPSMLGFTATCTQEASLAKSETVLSKIPSVESRARTCAEVIVCNRRLLELYGPSEDDPAKPKTAPPAAKNGVKLWLKTEEGEAALKSEIERVQPLLKPVTHEDLVDDIVLPANLDTAVFDDPAATGPENR